MKKCLMLLLLSASLLTANAQKIPLDHTVYDGWKSIANTQLTSDGKYLLYEVNPQEGNGKLIVRRLSDGRELTVARGYKAKIAKDNTTASLLIKAPISKIRKARNKKTPKDKMPKDSLALVNLSEMSIQKFELIKSMKTGVENHHFIAYIQSKAPNKNK